MTTYSIYLITSPIGKQYVGLSKDTAARFHYYVTHCKTRTNRAINSAFAKYGKDGMKLEIIETDLTIEKAQVREQYWIEELNTLAPNGYNLTTGGEVGKTHCEEVRLKISKSNLGKVMPDDVKRKIAETLKDRIFSEEHRIKLSIAGKGRIFTPEWRQKLSESKKGKPNLKLRGQTRTEEQKIRIGNSSRGRKWSDKAREQVSIARRAAKRKNSPEAIERMRLAALRRWAKVEGR